MSSPEPSSLDSVRALVADLSASVMGLPVNFLVSRDRKDPLHGRIYIQATYLSPCTVTREIKEWRGRKWYLSDHMTADEIVKTAFAAFKSAVEHEVMEGFLHQGHRIFNPHTPFTALIQASQTQVFREPQSPPEH